MKKYATLKNLVDLADRIEKDEAQLDSELRRRDRPVGREMSALTANPLAQLCGWLERITGQEGPSAGRRVASTLQVGTLVLVVAGLALGWLTAAAVFYYDGAHPVNIINALAFFVGFQLLLLLFTTLTFLPNKILRFLPGMQSLQEAFSLFSPGRLPRLFIRFLPARYKDAAASLIGQSSGHRSLYGRVEKWLIVRAGQAFGVAFNLGALTGCLYLVVFSDLAFGWSTTLQAEASNIKALTDGLSWPWAKLVPQAQPSFDLIETTRYFRFQAGSLPGIDNSSPAVLGEWWPFLIMCLLSYGLLPRILTLAISTTRLHKAARHTMLHLPGVQAILDRLNSQLVETQAEQPESALDIPLEGAPQSRFAGDLRGQSISVIDWGGTGLKPEYFGEWLQNSWGGTLGSFADAGGAFSLEHDRQVLQAISSAAGAIMLLVKSWEPPMAEFNDFIHDLRQEMGSKRPVAVVPVGIGSSTMPLPPAAEMTAVWHTMVKQLGDPWTFIAPPNPAGRQ